MAHHHLPLDDDELRMSLDDDMRALEALDAAEDVDMDALDGGEAGDGDVFRPSAMLDRRMEEEFGGAFYSTCFQASELVEKDLDGGFVDIEQMLLSESEEFLSAHFADTSDELLHEQLLRGVSGDSGGSEQQQRMICAEITARHFLHAKSSGGDSGSLQEHQQRLVLLKQAIASSSSSGLLSSSIFNMPPKYFEGGVQSSPQKRRAYRRTFGERTQSFTFGDSNSSNAGSLGLKQEEALPRSTLATASDCYHQQSGSTEPAVNDENCPPPSVTPSGSDVQIKEEMLDAYGVAHAQVAVDADDSMDEALDEEQKAAAVALESRTQTPVNATFAPFTGFRSISDDDQQQQQQQHNDEAEEEAMRTALRTPLRRSLSSPAPSTAAMEQQFTPLQQQLSGGGSGGYASRSMSPADAFEKVAVVVQVVKDSPGRVDKFEWRIGSGEQQQQQQSDENQARKRPNLSAQLGKADAILTPSLDEVSSEHDEASSGAGIAALPPRYFRGVTSSPQKRRVHSTTFGSFARSFSFTGSAPPSDL